MNKEVMINLGIILLLVIFYFLFRKRFRVDREYQKLYSEVVESEKYKVKGQYD